MTAASGHHKLSLVGRTLKNHTVLSKIFPHSKLNLSKKSRVDEAEKEPFIKTGGGLSSPRLLRHAASQGRSQPALDACERLRKLKSSQRQNRNRVGKITWLNLGHEL
jgi:hypothetical protein